jgi:glycosyltransferase involved in cell wall biosynthesis
MSDALVSVIIPAYKMGQFIGEAVESVGRQTYAKWEVIVVDDAGPEDGTRAAVEAFAAKHPDHRVEYIRHETNQGVSIARRTAFETLRGEYIAFLDADDAYLPEKLAKHVAILRAHPECALVHGSAMINGPVPPGAADLDKWFRDGFVEGVYDARTRDDYLARNHICNSTVVCCARLVQSADFPEGMVFQYEDWLLWLLLSGRGVFYFCDTPLTRYRSHSEAASWAMHAHSRSFALAHCELLLAFAPAGKELGVNGRVMGLLIDNLAALSAKPGLAEEGSARVRASLVCALSRHLSHARWRARCRFLGFFKRWATSVLR